MMVLLYVIPLYDEMGRVKEAEINEARYTSWPTGYHYCNSDT